MDAAVAPDVVAPDVVATPAHAPSLPVEIVGEWLTDTQTSRYKRSLIDKDMMLLMLRTQVKVTISATVERRGTTRGSTFER